MMHGQKNIILYSLCVLVYQPSYSLNFAVEYHI